MGIHGAGVDVDLCPEGSPAPSQSDLSSRSRLLGSIPQEVVARRYSQGFARRGCRNRCRSGIPAARTLAGAFADDPHFAWIVRDESKRLRRLELGLPLGLARPGRQQRGPRILEVIIHPIVPPRSDPGVAPKPARAGCLVPGSHSSRLPAGNLRSRSMARQTQASKSSSSDFGVLAFLAFMAF